MMGIGGCRGVKWDQEEKCNFSVRKFYDINNVIRIQNINSDIDNEEIISPKNCWRWGIVIKKRKFRNLLGKCEEWSGQEKKKTSGKKERSDIFIKYKFVIDNDDSGRWRDWKKFY